MQRKDNWPARLVAKIEAARDKPFSWGEHDCCTFASACVEAMTGENPMKIFKGRYRSEADAGSILRQKGAGNLLDTLTEILGKPVPVEKAERGDVVYSVFETGPSVGVCFGKNSYFVGEESGRDGLISLPTRESAKAFKI